MRNALDKRGTDRAEEWRNRIGTASDQTSINHIPSSQHRPHRYTPGGMKTSIPKRYSASIDLNNAPPPFAATTTTVEAPSAAITGAECLDAAPLDAEEI